VAAAQKSIQGHFKKAQGSSNSAVDADALFAQTQTLYYDPATGKDALCAELLNAYKTAVTAFLDKPVLTPAELATAKESASKAITPMGTKSGKVSDGEGRKIQLMQAVANGTDRLKMELKEKYKKIGYVLSASPVFPRCSPRPPYSVCAGCAVARRRCRRGSWSS
jgi:hypothetical protein